MKEKEVNFLYKEILKEVENILGSDTTYLSSLTKVAKQFLGDKYKGTFTSDAIPFLTDTKPYCILNLDKSTEGGSHWIGLVKYPKQTKYLLYDSFGRKTSDIIPSVLNKFGNGNVIDTDYDKEQIEVEMNCGQRSISFLILTDLFGVSNSKKL